MLATLPACALFGVDAFPIDVEVAVGGGLPGYHVVGLPAASVKEGAVRIRSALEHIGQPLPNRKITINLAPADRRKEGAAFELPIALGVLAASGAVSLEVVDGLMVLGELGLDASIRPIRGALAAAILAKRMGLRGLLLPRASAAEAAELDDLEVYVADGLAEVVAALAGECPLERYLRRPAGPSSNPSKHGDMSEVRGQHEARGAVEVAVAGGHNLLLVGPPGIGKTMLARRIPTVLPPLTRDEALETTKVHSSVQKGHPGLVRDRPFRAPHHTISAPALVGGGSPPKAGEVSLAHNGVLFLDEMPEFSRGALEALRQPIEDRRVTIGRVHSTITLPASFLLVASANPCPCGWLGSGERVCTDSSHAIGRYRSKLSGPLMNRIDLQVYVRNVPLHELRRDRAEESSEVIRNRVVEARERQRCRLAPYGVRTNAEMGPSVMRRTCILTDKAEECLRRIHHKRQGMTARTVDRLIKVARTIADLGGEEVIDHGCIFEAAAYRALEAEPQPAVLKPLKPPRSLGS